MQLNRTLSLGTDHIPSALLLGGALSLLLSLEDLSVCFTLFKFAFEEKLCNILHHYSLFLTTKRYPFIRWWPVSFLFQIFTFINPVLNPLLFILYDLLMVC